MKKGIVYLIVNNINEHKYVGITTMSLERRWSCHKRDSKKSNYPLYKSMRKDGIINFTIKPIMEIKCINKENLVRNLEKLEIKYIKFYESYIKWKNGGYNLTLGGNSSGRTIESRKKQSITMKKKYKENPELKEMYTNAIKNAYKNNLEIVKKLSKIQKHRYEDDKERKKTGDSIRKSYVKNPYLRKKSSKVHKELNKSRPELGREHSIRISGSNHPLFNNTIYTFNNINTNDEFKGTSYDFRIKYKLYQGSISLLINGKTKNYKGWKVEFDKIEI